MYCIKCGRQGHSGEKRCPDCGMRLVTPARLKELIELEKYVNQTFSGKLSIRYKRLKKRTSKRWAKIRSGLGSFFGKLFVDLRAFGGVSLRVLKNALKALWAFLKRAYSFLKKHSVSGAKKLCLLLKKAGAKLRRKAAELRQQYRQEREKQQILIKEERAQRPITKRRPVQEEGDLEEELFTEWIVPARAKSKASMPQKKSAAQAHKPQRTESKTHGAPIEKNVRTDRKGEIKPNRAYLTGAGGKPSAANTYAARQLSRDIANERYREKQLQSEKARKKRKKKPFSREWTEEHMRSLVAMGLMLTALIVFVFWGAFSDSGQKTLAGIGLGSARGYMLIGDEYMAEKNYPRAVEYYYSSISSDLSYEAALKLAIAYSYTGDVSKEVSALLLLTENYPENKLPFSQLYALYPEGSARPQRVQQAIEKGFALYGAL
ncbi:MAG: hypothetical protein II875_02820 [Clostridia bacterium]|nr:hypothetical protein [Clostridia bacterium]